MGTTRPAPRGPLTRALFAHWDGGRSARAPGPEDLVGIDPLADDDLQLALWCCYQHERGGFDGRHGVGSDPVTAAFGQRLEEAVEAALRTEHACDQVPPDPAVALRVIATWAGRPLARAVEEDGERRHLRELAVHRSVQLLREPDWSTRTLARLVGRERAALLPEDGREPAAGPGDDRRRLFVTAMAELGLDATEGRYVDRLPGVTLATDNVISMLGRHRRLGGALVGHLALTELSRVEPMARYRAAVRRIGGLSALERFYDARLASVLLPSRSALDDLVGPLVAADPELAPEVVFGAAAVTHVEARFERHVLSAWRRGESSLLPDPGRDGAASGAASAAGAGAVAARGTSAGASRWGSAAARAGADGPRSGDPRAGRHAGGRSRSDASAGS